MTHEGIEFVIRTGLSRNEWAVTIQFPNASDALAGASVVKVTGTRDEAIATAHKRIEGWLKRRRKKGSPTLRQNRLRIRYGDARVLPATVETDRIS
jgi:hypothetical protein